MPLTEDEFSLRAATALLSIFGWKINTLRELKQKSWMFLAAIQLTMYYIGSKHSNQWAHGVSADCQVDNKLVKEGAPVETRSNCSVCFCLRGEVRCQPLGCAPPLAGCRPLLARGDCCAHQYVCDHDEPAGKRNEPAENHYEPAENDDKPGRISYNVWKSLTEYFIMLFAVRKTKFCIFAIQAKSQKYAMKKKFLFINYRHGICRKTPREPWRLFVLDSFSHNSLISMNHSSIPTQSQQW